MIVKSMSLKVGIQADAGDNIKYCERAGRDAVDKDGEVDGVKR